MTDLEILIKNIEDLSSGRIYKRPMIKYMIYQVYYKILLEMAKETAVDTGYARGLVVKVFAERFGYWDEELQNLANEFYYHWESRGYRASPTDRSWITASEGQDLEISIIGNDVFLSIADEGLVNQEIHGKVAIYHPRPDVYYGHHISMVASKVNTGNLKEIDIVLNELADEIVKEIESGLGV